MKSFVFWLKFHRSLFLRIPLTINPALVNTLRPRRNEQHFADDIFKRIFFNENVWISIEISLKFVPKGPINNIPTLVQIMAWRRPGDKPLSEPMMVSLMTHICVTRPQWVKIMIWRWIGDKPLSEPMMVSLLTSLGLNELIWVLCLDYVQYWANKVVGEMFHHLDYVQGFLHPLWDVGYLTATPQIIPTPSTGFTQLNQDNPMCQASITLWTPQDNSYQMVK